MPSDSTFDENDDFVSQNASEDTPQAFTAPAGNVLVSIVLRSPERHRRVAPLSFDQGAPSKAQFVIPK